MCETGTESGRLRTCSPIAASLIGNCIRRRFSPTSIFTPRTLASMRMQPGRRQDGLYLLLLGMSIVVLLTAYLLGTPTGAAQQDFRVVYNPARCLLRHYDPYQPDQVQRLLREEGRERPSESESDREIITRYLYPPTAFALTAPFAMLRWDTARRLWSLCSVGILLCAAFLAWDLSADYEPVLGGVMIGFLLANSEVLVVLGNPTGIVIGLCVTAVWCFLRQRLLLLGVVCLALSLAIKPQVAGLIWIFFLLAGKNFRKQALQSLIAFAALGLPVVLWVWQVSPHWISEWQSNLLVVSARGGPADPGPASTASHGAGQMICLQTVFSAFRDDPRFYNTASYLVVGPLLLIWIYLALRRSPSIAGALLALAALVPLSLLPVYHHVYDAKLLLLAVPGCALLWQEQSPRRVLAVLVTSAALFLTGDIPSSFLFQVADTALSAHHAGSQFRQLVVSLPIPLVLLGMAVFYLHAYWTHSEQAIRPAVPGKRTPPGIQNERSAPA